MKPDPASLAAVAAVFARVRAQTAGTMPLPHRHAWMPVVKRGADGRLHRIPKRRCSICRTIEPLDVRQKVLEREDRRLREAFHEEHPA